MQSLIAIKTPGRGLVPVTEQIAEIVARSAIRTGICHVFLRHTSAGLVISENADAAVCEDLERYMARAVPDGDPMYEHDEEGPDDMPAHIRSILAGLSVSIPVGEGKLLLGTWQGIYLWEHRRRPHTRELVVTLLGK